MLFGLALLAGELATPGGFYVLFFGIGALLIGGLAAAGLVIAPALQWILFSAFSVAALVLFRRRLLASFQSSERREPIDTLRGEIAVPLEELAPGAVGRAELRGTSWSARNVGERALRAGERCRVDRVDGLTLLLRGESA